MTNVHRCLSRATPRRPATTAQRALLLKQPAGHSVSMALAAALACAAVAHLRMVALAGGSGRIHVPCRCAVTVASCITDIIYTHIYSIYTYCLYIYIYALTLYLCILYIVYCIGAIIIQYACVSKHEIRRSIIIRIIVCPLGPPALPANALHRGGRRL